MSINMFTDMQNAVYAATEYYVSLKKESLLHATHGWTLKTLDLVK